MSADSPTPAAPAGSGAWRAALERLVSLVGDGLRDSDTTAIDAMRGLVAMVLNERAAREREAALVALCEESLAAHSTVFDFGRHTNVTWKDALSKRDELRARLASLAAPEGGTR